MLFQRHDGGVSVAFRRDADERKPCYERDQTTSDDKKENSVHLLLMRGVTVRSLHLPTKKAAARASCSKPTWAKRSAPDCVSSHRCRCRAKPGELPQVALFLLSPISTSRLLLPDVLLWLEPTGLGLGIARI